MKKLISLLLLLMASVLAFAQDKIYTRLQKNPIEGEVVEVSTSEVKYKPVDRPLPIITIDKQDVIKIVYKNGQTLAINNPMTDYTMYKGQHLWNIKLSLLSPMLGHTQLFLEHSQKPGRSIEYELNIIGLGKDQKMNNFDFYDDDLYLSARGVGVGVGWRFLRMPDFVNGQVRLRHIMQGSYIKPAISVNVYSRNFFVPPSPSSSVGHTERKTVVAVNPNIALGRQWILDNTISLEVYGLLGYSMDNVRSQEKKIADDSGQPDYFSDNQPFNGFGYTRFSRGDFGISLGCGIRVGFLFDFKKQQVKDNQ